MTALILDLTQPRDRVRVFVDSLGYTLAGQHDPLGSVDKVVGFPARRAVLCASGIFELQVRVGCELMLRPDLASFEAVVAALPDILRAETETLADIHGIDDPAGRMLLDAIYVGLNERSDQFEAVVFSNYKDDYAPQRGSLTGFVALPNVPASYVPPGFDAMAPTAKGIAAIKSVRQFLLDHVPEHPGLGGEIVESVVDRDGVHSRVVSRFKDHETTKEEAAETWRAIAAGERKYEGAGLTTKLGDRPAALAALEERLRQTGALDDGPALSRQQRRAAARRSAA